MASLLDLYRSVFGGEADQGAPMAVQNRQGGFDPYRPSPLPDALEMLKSATGYTDLEQAGQAYGRGEYLPALGQGAWGAAQAAATAFPALKAGGAALRAGAPLAREAAAAIPRVMADQGGAFRFGGTPIRAYHGSPGDFDRFDPRRANTGWGEEQFGHGINFTKDEELARLYRNGISGWQVGGGAPDPANPLHNAAIALTKAEGRRPQAMDELYEISKASWPGMPADLVARQQQAAAALRVLQQGDELPPAASTGRMYEVDLRARPEQLLNWDTPLSAQPELIKPLQQMRGYSPERTGGEFYQALQSGYGIDPRGASRFLAKSGIPGSSHLDDSVGNVAPGGAENFTIFDPRIIEIRRKYGLPLTAGAGGLGGLGGLGGQESYY